MLTTKSDIWLSSKYIIDFSKILVNYCTIYSEIEFTEGMEYVIT